MDLNTEINKAQFARLFCEIIGVYGGGTHSYFDDIHSDDPDVRYIASLHFAFPNPHWTGKQWHARKNDPVTVEMAVKSFVIFKGFLLPSFDEARSLTETIFPELISKGYSQDSIIYFAALIKLGANFSNFTRNIFVTLPIAEEILTFLSSCAKNFSPEIVPSRDQIIISNKPYIARQGYYQDGPIRNYITVKSDVQGERLHQYCGLFSSTDIRDSQTSYGIGLWGDATSYARDTKVVGGFFTVTRAPEGEFSQIVGQEIDVIHMTVEGQVNDRSSVGIQLVTIGNAFSTAAVELISDHKSAWRHGIIVDEGAMSEDGTILAVSQTAPMRLGIDFGNSVFTDAAIRIKNNQVIKFESKDYTFPASIYLDDREFLKIKSGKSGFAIVPNDGGEPILLAVDGKLILDNAQILMKSENGSKFILTIDNNGILKTIPVK